MNPHKGIRIPISVLKHIQTIDGIEVQRTEDSGKFCGKHGIFKMVGVWSTCHSKINSVRIHFKASNIMELMEKINTFKKIALAHGIINPPTECVWVGDKNAHRDEKVKGYLTYIMDDKTRTLLRWETTSQYLVYFNGVCMNPRR